MKNKLGAIIPVRAGSRRLPNKNILPFGSSNLLVHKIRQLKEVRGIDEITVSSDSDEMLEMARNEGVNTHKRAIEYCDEKTKTFGETVEHIASRIDCDILMWAPCVCPLVEKESYEKAIETYKNILKTNADYDSVVSVKIFKEYLWDDKKAVNYDPDNLVPTQLLPDWKVIVNGFYIMSKENMVNLKHVYGKKPFFYVLNKKQAVDIDDAEDFETAKALLRK